jgi:hypothetical protein
MRVFAVWVELATTCRFSARMTPIRANITGPPDVATSIKASIAACHSGAFDAAQIFCGKSLRERHHRVFVFFRHQFPLRRATLDGLGRVRRLALRPMHSLDIKEVADVIRLGVNLAPTALEF